MSKFVRMFLLILGIIGLSYLPVSGQTVVQKISDESCKCIERLSRQRSGDLDLSEATGGCVQTAMMAHLKEINDSYQIDMSDAGASKALGEEIGTEVGMILAKNCPAFLNLMTRAQVQEKKKTLPGTLIDGTLAGKRIDEMTYLEIRDPYGARLSFLWLRKFDGAERLSGGIEPLIGKNVRVKWEEVEYYSSAMQDYVKAREIVAMEFID